MRGEKREGTRFYSDGLVSIVPEADPRLPDFLTVLPERFTSTDIYTFCLPRDDGMKPGPVYRQKEI
jgi:hypothetical protein